MKLILVGCEYSGTTTLAHAIDDWAEENLGSRFSLIHDHFKIPHTIGHPSDLSPEEQQQYLALSPRIIETAQRHNVYYHTPYRQAPETDLMVIGLHIEEKIWGQLYFGYGGEGEVGDRRVVSGAIEHRIITYAPETVLVHVKATPNAIARRMKETPHESQLLKEGDIERVLEIFEEEHNRSMILRKFTLETSTATVKETIDQFAELMEPYFTAYDRLRLLSHRPPSSD